MKNKKGQVGTWAFAIMLMMVVIILALSFAPVLKSFIDDAMGTTTADFIGLDCSTTDSNFVKGVCVLVDFSLVYFIIGLLLIGVGLIGAKYIW